MTISNTIPSTLRRPGEFHEFDFTSAATGLVPLANRVLLVGVQGATATATVDVSEQVFDELQSDGLFEQGSEAALMCRKALEVGRLLGFQPEIHCAGIVDPGGTAAIHRIETTAGSAAAAGDIEFRIGEISFRAGVSAGDDQDAVTLAIIAAVDEKLAEIPVTAAAGLANQADLTFNYTGVNGNDLIVIIDSVGLTGLTVAASTPTPGVGVAVATTALDNSLATYFEMKAIANHTTADVTILAAHLALAWAPSAKRWAFSVMGENGTLSAANTLSAAANSERQVIASYEQSTSMPMQIAAAMAVSISAREQPNFNWDFQDIPLGIPPDAAVYTDTELESALAAGTTPLKPNDNRTQSQVNRLITTKTTEGGNPFEPLKDLAVPRAMVFSVRQLDAVFSTRFKGLNKSPNVIKRMRSAAYNTLKQLEILEVLQLVDELFPQLLFETDPVVVTRVVSSIPMSPVQNLHQLVMVHKLFSL